ncbi:DUF523 domain-containing protein [Pleomorphomonas sp. PLEO]|uniref:DUF523 domain-containing protein n=1 Tax=Pleomorphomonas sp. PLEO TaxID=3239306 RepID=UPI00351F4ED6
MDRILISACLLGRPVRYDGAGKRLDDPRLERWQAEGRLVPVCPELMGDLSVPRPAAEIVGGSGADVLAGRARVVTVTGEDVTAAFVAGAEAALEYARRSGCVYALLIDRSPSCGSLSIYDGSFSGRRLEGAGVTAALLAAHGIGVFADHDIDRLAKIVDVGLLREPDAG